MILQAMLISGLTALLAPASYLFAQDNPGDRDTTPHSIRFVAVEDEVKLEVLDWAGPAVQSFYSTAATAPLTTLIRSHRN